MAALTGKLQGIKSQFSYTVGSGAATQLVSLSSWELDVKADEIDGSDHDSAGWADILTGLAKWTGSVKAVRFDGDASQQGLEDALAAALVGNTTITGLFMPVKNTGNPAYSGNFSVTGYKPSDGGTKGIQTLDFTLSGRGPLTRVVQA